LPFHAVAPLNPADTGGTIAEIAKDFVSRATPGAMANDEHSNAWAGFSARTVLGAAQSLPHRISFDSNFNQLVPLH
jgi:hypothetical protein